MKRRNFFQSLVAGAAALMLPGGKDVEAEPADATSDGDTGFSQSGQGAVSLGGSPSQVYLTEYDATYSMDEPTKITGNARADGPILPGAVVAIDDGGMLKACTKEQPPVGVVESSSCKTDPITGRKSYFAEIIIKS